MTANVVVGGGRAAKYGDIGIGAVMDGLDG